MRNLTHESRKPKSEIRNPTSASGFGFRISCVGFLRVMPALTLTVALVPWAAADARAEPDEGSDPDEIPLVGRPADLPFSEASGNFRASVRAEPTAVEAEEPVLLTLTVKAVGPVKKPPQRLDLGQVRAFAERFHIEGPADADAHPDPRTWEFVYRLRPRRADVSEIPGVPFVWFNPEIQPASKGFQMVFTDPVPLEVRPRAAFQTPLTGPETLFQLGTGSSLFARQTPWSPPGPIGAGLLLLTPPALCWAWYAWWRRRYPDTARLSRQRRSRAARAALCLLERAEHLAPAEQAQQAAEAVAGYLQQRLDLPVADPTPAETARHLLRLGCSLDLTEQAERFFRTCDAVRFLPAPDANGGELVQTANRFILALEAETWKAPPSFSPPS
jgi:hypothetical protein